MSECGHIFIPLIVPLFLRGVTGGGAVIVGQHSSLIRSRLDLIGRGKTTVGFIKIPKVELVYKKSYMDIVHDFGNKMIWEINLRYMKLVR